jgi:hypothetical protein
MQTTAAITNSAETLNSTSQRKEESKTILPGSVVPTPRSDNTSESKLSESKNNKPLPSIIRASSVLPSDFSKRDIGVLTAFISSIPFKEDAKGRNNMSILAEEKDEQKIRKISEFLKSIEPFSDDLVELKTDLEGDMGNIEERIRDAMQTIATSSSGQQNSNLDSDYLDPLAKFFFKKARQEFVKEELQRFIKENTEDEDSTSEKQGLLSSGALSKEDMYLYNDLLGDKISKPIDDAFRKKLNKYDVEFNKLLERIKPQPRKYIFDESGKKCDEGGNEKDKGKDENKAAKEIKTAFIKTCKIITDRLCLIPKEELPAQNILKALFSCVAKEEKRKIAVETLYFLDEQQVEKAVRSAFSKSEAEDIIKNTCPITAEDQKIQQEKARFDNIKHPSAKQQENYSKTISDIREDYWRKRRAPVENKIIYLDEKAFYKEIDALSNAMFDSLSEKQSTDLFSSIVRWLMLEKVYNTQLAEARKRRNRHKILKRQLGDFLNAKIFSHEYEQPKKQEGKSDEQPKDLVQELIKGTLPLSVTVPRQDESKITRFLKGKEELTFEKINNRLTEKKKEVKLTTSEKISRGIIAFIFGGGKVFSTMTLCLVFAFTLASFFHLGLPILAIIAIGLVLAIANGITSYLTRYKAIEEAAGPDPIKKQSCFKEDKKPLVKGVLLVVAIIASVAAGVMSYFGVVKGIAMLVSLITGGGVVLVSSPWLLILAGVLAVGGAVAFFCFQAKEIGPNSEKFLKLFQGGWQRNTVTAIVAVVILLATGIVAIYSIFKGVAEFLFNTKISPKEDPTSFLSIFIGVILAGTTIITNLFSTLYKLYTYITGAKPPKPATTPSDFAYELDDKSGMQRLKVLWNDYCAMPMFKKCTYPFIMIFDMLAYGGIGSFISTISMLSFLGLGLAAVLATSPWLIAGCVFALINMGISLSFTWSKIYHEAAEVAQKEKEQKGNQSQGQGTEQEQTKAYDRTNHPDRQRADINDTNKQTLHILRRSFDVGSQPKLNIVEPQQNQNLSISSNKDDDSTICQQFRSNASYADFWKHGLLFPTTPGNTDSPIRVTTIALHSDANNNKDNENVPLLPKASNSPASGQN